MKEFLNTTRLTYEINTTNSINNLKCLLHENKKADVKSRHFHHAKSI